MTTDSPPTGPAPPVVLVVVGRIDTTSLAALRDRLTALVAAVDAQEVHCDLARLETCDLVAVGVLARLGLTARGLGCQFRLVRPPDRLLEAVAFVGLEHALRVAEDRTQP